MASGCRAQHRRTTATQDTAGGSTSSPRLGRALSAPGLGRTVTYSVFESATPPRRQTDGSPLRGARSSMRCCARFGCGSPDRERRSMALPAEDLAVRQRVRPTRLGPVTVVCLPLPGAARGPAVVLPRESLPAPHPSVVVGNSQAFAEGPLRGLAASRTNPGVLENPQREQRGVIKYLGVRQSRNVGKDSAASGIGTTTRTSGRRTTMRLPRHCYLLVWVIVARWGLVLPACVVRSASPLSGRPLHLVARTMKRGNGPEIVGASASN